MARPRKWSAGQRDRALQLFVEHGPSAAEQITGIPKQTIFSWAAPMGLRTVRHAKTRAAVETRRARMEERRLELAVLQQDAAIKVTRLAMSPVVTIITDETTGTQVLEERERPAKDVQALAMASAILTDKAELLMSRITTPSRMPTIGEEFASDHERRVLRALLEEAIALEESGKASWKHSGPSLRTPNGADGAVGGVHEDEEVSGQTAHLQ